MLMNEMMNTRIMASFLDEKTPLRGYLTESGFFNVAKMIIEGRTSDIRECTECYTCFKTSRKGRAIECSVNTDLWA